MEILSYILFSGVVFVGSVAIVLVFGAVIHISGKIGEQSIPLLIITLGIGLVLTTFLSGRNLTYVGVSLENLDSAADQSVIFVRVLSWSIFVFALASCLDRIFVRSRQKLPLFYRGNWFVILMIFGLTNNITGAIFGTHPNFSPGLLHPIAVLAFLALDDKWNIDSVLVASRIALFIVLLTGLILLPIMPSLVLEQHSNGFIPFVHFRYWGITGHANSVGPIAIVFLLVRYLKPFTKDWLNWLSVLVAILSLLLSQSKTALIGGLVGFITIQLVQTLNVINFKRGILEWKLVHVVRVAMLFTGVMTCIALFIFVYTHAHGAKVLSSGAGASIETLSGRTRIWEVALYEWHKNPIFGYGPDLFNLEHRMRIGMNFAFHAHNQFVQSVSQSGIVGFFGLLLLLAVGGWQSVKTAMSTKGVSLAIFLFLLVRSITEVPFRSMMMSGEFILIIVWVAILMAYYKPKVFINPTSPTFIATR